MVKPAWLAVEVRENVGELQTAADVMDFCTSEKDIQDKTMAQKMLAAFV